MKNFSPIKRRVIEHLKNEGISKKAFYEKTGIPNGTLDKESGVSEMFIEKYISSYPLINPDWLIKGKGDMFLKGGYYPDNDDVSYKANLLSEADDEYQKGIPLMDIRAVAGFGNGQLSIDKHDIKEYYIVPKFKHKKIDFMIEVEGTSMYPKYNSGDVVACTIISGNKFIQWNKVHVIVTIEQGLIVKRVKKGSEEGYLLMISDNKSYSPFEVHIDQITSMALVVGVIRLE